MPRGNKIKGGAPARASALVGERLSVVDVGDDGKISDFRLVGQKNTPPKDGEWSSNIGVYPRRSPADRRRGQAPALQNRVMIGAPAGAPALRALRIPAATALVFQGHAPMAARRAQPVQRSRSQGLRGNRDACRPRRGSACDASEHGAPAEAQRSTRKGHAASVRRQSRQRLRSGFGRESFPAKRRQWRIKRAGKKERRDWRASLARESQCRDGSKGPAEGMSFRACPKANDP